MIRARLDQPTGRIVVLIGLDEGEIEKLRTDDAPDVLGMADLGLDVDVLLAGPAAIEEFKKLPKFAFVSGEIEGAGQG